MARRYGPLGTLQASRAPPTEAFVVALILVILFGIKPRTVWKTLKKVASETHVSQLVRTLSREFSQESLFQAEPSSKRPLRDTKKQPLPKGMQKSHSETNLPSLFENDSLSTTQSAAAKLYKHELPIATAPVSQRTDAYERQLAKAVRPEEAQPNVADSPVAPLLSRMARWGAFRVDRFFFMLLGAQCTSLLVYVLNGKYFFGLKFALLQWAARSMVARSWLKLVLPLGNIGLLFLMYAVVNSYPLKKHVIQRWRALACLNVTLLYAVQRLYELIRGDATAVLMAESSAEVRDVISFVPPSKSTVNRVTRLLRCYMPITLLHTDRIQQKERLLFVGNHSLFAIDTPLVVSSIYVKTDIFCRAFAEHSWFALPGLAELMACIAGVVDGTPENCDALMESGANLLVYPGGAKEAWKLTTDKKYGLKWDRNPTGFARLAIKHKYTVVCLPCIGVEDALHPCVDVPISSILRLGGLIRPNKKSFFLKEGSKIPILAPPNPMEAQRLYCQFGHPIWTDGPSGITDPDELREMVKKELQSGIEQLKTYREHDPNRYVFRAAPSSL